MQDVTCHLFYTAYTTIENILQFVLNMSGFNLKFSVKSGELLAEKLNVSMTLFALWEASHTEDARSASEV